MYASVLICYAYRVSSSESRRVILIISAFVVIGVGGALYYLLVYQPGKDREAARAQITAWEGSWDAARRCMLGDEPLAADIGDAMTARELVIGTTEEAMGDCTKSVAALVRPPGHDTGVSAVESAWPRLEVAVSRVAQAYATHRMQPLGDNPLPAALDELTAAHAALRRAAGMSALPKNAAPPAVALAPSPLGLDGAPVADLGGITVGGVLRGRAQVNGKGAYDVAWSGKGLEGTPAGDGQRSVPDHAWAAYATSTEKTTALTAGDPQVTITSIKAGAGTLAPLLAVGETEHRLVLYAIDQSLFVARSGDAGKTWAIAPVPSRGQVAFAATPAGDRVDVAWTAADALQLLTIDPSADAKSPLPAPVALPAQELATWCTGARAWYVGATATGYLVFPDGKPPGIALEVKHPRPIVCNADVLVVRGETREGRGVDVACRATACTPLPDTGDERATGLVGEHVYRAATRTNLVAVWRDADPVRFYHLPVPRDIYAIVDVGGAPVMLLLDSERLALDQVPLP
jgi:hypothetical protein